MQPVELESEQFKDFEAKWIHYMKNTIEHNQFFFFSVITGLYLQKSNGFFVFVALSLYAFLIN